MHWKYKGAFDWTSSGTATRGIVRELAFDWISSRSRTVRTGSSRFRHAHTEATFPEGVSLMEASEYPATISDPLAGPDTDLWCPSEPVSYERLIEEAERVLEQSANQEEPLESLETSPNSSSYGV